MHEIRNETITESTTQTTTQTTTESTTQITTQTTTKYVAPSTINWYTVEGVIGGKLQFDTSTGMIVGAENTITQLHIPEKINGVGVQGFSEGVFKDLVLLTSVKIPYGIAYISVNMFYGCINLNYIYLPSTIVKIGSNAFYGVKSLKNLDFGGSEWGWNNNVILDTGNDYLNNSTKKYAITYSKSYNIVDVYTNAFYNFKLNNITSGTCTIVSGSLPPGIGLYSDGLLYGIPTKSGIYTFIVNNNNNYYQYTININAPTSNNLTSTNKYSITTMLPTITSNTQDYYFIVDRQNIYFNCLYINGVRLVLGIDYEISGTTNTKIIIYSSSLSRLPKGENIVTAIFNTTNDNTSGNYGNANTGSSSQIFYKESVQVTSSSMPFEDVKISDWYYNSLEYLYKNNIIKGKTDIMFSPSDSLTRAELVSLLYRINGETVIIQNSFTDVSVNDWYADAITWAKNNSIVYGTGDGTTFSPNDSVTKEDIATILNRYCSYKQIQIPSGTSQVVSDINAVADYAKIHVNTMYQGNILNVDSNNNFNPKIFTSRADAAYILANLLLKY